MSGEPLTNQGVSLGVHVLRVDGVEDLWEPIVINEKPMRVTKRLNFDGSLDIVVGYEQRGLDGPFIHREVWATYAAGQWIRVLGGTARRQTEQDRQEQLEAWRRTGPRPGSDDGTPTS